MRGIMSVLLLIVVSYHGTITSGCICVYTFYCRVFTHALGGPLQNPRLCIVHEAQSSHFYWQIYYSTIQDGLYCSPSDVEMYLEQLVPSSGCVIFPGIRSYPDQIRFTTKNLQQWGPPFNQMFSANCAQWHLPNNA